MRIVKKTVWWSEYEGSGLLRQLQSPFLPIPQNLGRYLLTRTPLRHSIPQHIRFRQQVRATIQRQQNVALLESGSFCRCMRAKLPHMPDSQRHPGGRNPFATALRLTHSLSFCWCLAILHALHFDQQQC